MATMTYSPALAGTASSARTSRRRAGSPPVRLTRRGRLIITLGVAVFAAVGWFGTHATAQADAPLQRIEVKAGDTLWSIAQRIAPGTDPRETVYDLRELNHLATAQLQPGQILLVR